MASSIAAAALLAAKDLGPERSIDSGVEWLLSALVYETGFMFSLLALYRSATML